MKKNNKILFMVNVFFLTIFFIGVFVFIISTTVQSSVEGSMNEYIKEIRDDISKNCSSDKTIELTDLQSKELIQMIGDIEYQTEVSTEVSTEVMTITKSDNSSVENNKKIDQEIDKNDSEFSIFDVDFSKNLGFNPIKKNIFEEFYDKDTYQINKELIDFVGSEEKAKKIIKAVIGFNFYSKEDLNLVGTDGSKINWNELIGEPMLIFIGRLGCPNCEYMAGDIYKFAQETGIKTIKISSRNTLSELTDYNNEYNFYYTVYDRNNEFVKSFGAKIWCESVPQLIFVDEIGVAHFAYTGLTTTRCISNIWNFVMPQYKVDMIMEEKLSPLPILN